MFSSSVIFSLLFLSFGKKQKEQALVSPLSGGEESSGYWMCGWLESTVEQSCGDPHMSQSDWTGPLRVV
jgi:hypothetical protein